MPHDKSLQKRLLLAGRSRKKHKAAAELGCRLVAVMTMSQLKTTDLGLYESVVGVAENAPAEDWVRAAQLLADQAPVDALGCFFEPLEDIGQQIGEALNLSYLPAEQIRVARDKHLMRNKLREAGIEDVSSCLLETPLATSIRSFLDTQDGGIIVKPYNGRASRAVSHIRSTDDIPAAISWIEASGVSEPMVAEPFLLGPEFSIEVISHEGRHHVVAITEKIKDPVHFVELGHTVPALISSTTSNVIETYVNQVLEALGHQSGPSHIEVILTEHGPRMVELHFRVGGDDIDLLCRHITGLDMNRIWVEQILGIYDPAPLDQIRHDGVAGIRFVSSPKQGVLQGVDGLESINDIDGVIEAKKLVDDGEEVTILRESDSRIVSIMAHAKDRPTLNDIFDQAESRLSLRVV